MRNRSPPASSLVRIALIAFSRSLNHITAIRSAPQASDTASLGPRSLKKAPSVRSSRSAVTSIFRRATNPRSSALVEEWQDLHLHHMAQVQEGITSPTFSADNASVFSGRTVMSTPGSTNGRFSRFLPGSSSPEMETMMPPPPPRTASSVRRLQSSSSSLRSGKSISRRPGSSSSSSQTSPSTRRKANASNESSILPLLEDDPDATPSELRREIAQLEAEHGRVANEFRQLEARLQGRMDDEGAAVEGELKRVKERRRKVGERYEARLECVCFLLC